MNQTIFVFLALTLYILFKQVHKSAARAMVVLVLLAAAISSLNVVFEFAGLQVATGAVDMSSLGTEGSNAMVLLLLDTQHYGLLIAQMFFGLWLVPLGYLAHKSGWFPKALALVLVVAGGCYVVDLLTAFLVPDCQSDHRRFHRHPVHHRRSLDARIPAHHRRADRQDREVGRERPRRSLNSPRRPRT